VVQITIISQIIRLLGHVFLYITSSNNFVGGTISYYSLWSVGTTNNFTNTGFTVQRQFRFIDSTPWFNYNNETDGSIWLKTTVSSASIITRTLTTWSQAEMAWNDTNSTAGITATYNLTGLFANTNYSIYNTTSSGTTTQYLTTDSNGILPSFTIFLNGNTEIKVIDDTPPDIYFIPPTPDDGNITSNDYAYINVTATDTNNITAFIDWNNSLVGWWRFNNETDFTDHSTYSNDGINWRSEKL